MRGARLGYEVIRLEVAKGCAGRKRVGEAAAPQGAWGQGSWAAWGAGLGHLTESHLIHGPLFLHAGHRRRLLLILCGQRMRMKSRGAPGGGAERARPVGVASGRAQARVGQ